MDEKKSEVSPEDTARAKLHARVLGRALFSVRGMTYTGESSICITDSDDTLTGEQLDVMRGVTKT